MPKGVEGQAFKGSAPAGHPPFDLSQRRRLARKMARAAIDCLEEAEYNSLMDWAAANITCDLQFIVEDGIKLAIAFDGVGS